MAERLKMNNVLLSHKEINLDTKTVPYSLEQLSADDPEIIFVVTMGKAEEINKKWTSKCVIIRPGRISKP